MPWVILALAAVAFLVELGRRSGSAPDGRLDAAQARSILGVSVAADRAEIEAAYRRLMLQAHPDRGGSSQWAARLNAARDVLLGRR